MFHCPTVIVATASSATEPPEATDAGLADTVRFGAHIVNDFCCPSTTCGSQPFIIRNGR